MFKTLTAGLMALSLTLVPAAPVQAQQSNEDLQRAIVSLLALGAVGLAIKNNSDNREEARETRRQPVEVAPQRAPRNVHDNHRRNYQDFDRQNRRVDLVPGRCFRRVETARGGYQGVFVARCLERRYRDADTLPRQCLVRIGGNNGNRRGYDAACLRDFGYRSDRRWN